MFELNGYKIEFKSENELNSDGTPYFTWDEAMELFCKPDAEGWRLPTKEDFEALIDKYPYGFKDKQGIFDNRIYLPAIGYRLFNRTMVNKGLGGEYWSSTPNASDRAWVLYFNWREVHRQYNFRCNGVPVRLMREV